MTKPDKDDRQEPIGAEGIEALLRLLVTRGDQRISSAVVEGRMVWIKQLSIGARSIGKWLHSAVTPVVPKPFLRSSPKVDAKGRAQRELRKIAAFRAAGFHTADVLYEAGEVLVFSNVGLIVRDALNSTRTIDPVDHDRLLIACAEALALAHSAGLCHGRPHPRDMFIEDGALGFIDFEEEPEAAMPLEAAQARDVWLLFQQIASRAIDKDTAGKALDVYVAGAPPAAVRELHNVVQFFGKLLPILRAAGPFVGHDGKRLRDGTGFLKSALAKRTAQAAARPVAVDQFRKHHS